MALVRKPVMTEKKLAANRRNQLLAHGPTTAEGLERIRDAHLRHGLYAKAQEPALLVLGEDAALFENLLEGLRQEFTPTGVLQEELVIRLTRALWLTERLDRSQEGHVLRRARTADSGRANRLHSLMMRLKMTAETLRSLGRTVAEWHYVTTREDLELMKKLHQEGVMAEMGEIALTLFYQLQALGTDKDGVSEQERYRRMTNSMRSIFGIPPIEEPVHMLSPSGENILIKPEGWVEEPASNPEGEEVEDPGRDDRYPNITPEEWKARERARKLLKNILTRQAESCETQRQDLLKETIAGPTAWERAAEITLDHPEAFAMSRLQEPSFREVRRITDLLLKLKARESKLEAREDNDSASSHDVSGNKDS